MLGELIDHNIFHKKMFLNRTKMFYGKLQEFYCIPFKSFLLLWLVTKYRSARYFATVFVCLKLSSSVYQMPSFISTINIGTSLTVGVSCLTINCVRPKIHFFISLTSGPYLNSELLVFSKWQTLIFLWLFITLEMGKFTTFCILTQGRLERIIKAT